MKYQAGFICTFAFLFSCAGTQIMSSDSLAKAALGPPIEEACQSNGLNRCDLLVDSVFSFSEETVAAFAQSNSPESIGKIASVMQGLALSPAVEGR